MPRRSITRRNGCPAAPRSWRLAPGSFNPSCDYPARLTRWVRKPSMRWRRTCAACSCSVASCLRSIARDRAQYRSALIRGLDVLPCCASRTPCWYPDSKRWATTRAMHRVNRRSLRGLPRFARVVVRPKARLDLPAAPTNRHLDRRDEPRACLHPTAGPRWAGQRPSACVRHTIARLLPRIARSADPTARARRPRAQRRL